MRKGVVRKRGFNRYIEMRVKFAMLLKELQTAKNTVDAKEAEIAKLLEEYHAS